MTPFRSPTSYVANHLSMLASGQQALATSLFLGGVTQRFPTMNFAFLEGGVTWAAALFSDIVGHWEKRNIAALRDHLDPSLVDRDVILGHARPVRPRRRRLPPQLTRRPAEPEDLLDEFAACGIDRPEDIRARFAERFWFGCEADDPMTSLAFNTAVNPFGAELQVMLGSDISHWDLPDVSEVLEEAHEMVEHGWIDDAAFRTSCSPIRPASTPGPTRGSSRAPSSGRPWPICWRGLTWPIW